MRLTPLLMEVMGTTQKYLKANEVKSLMGLYVKKLLVSILELYSSDSSCEYLFNILLP